MARKNNSRATIVYAPRLPRAVRHEMIATFGEAVTHDRHRCRCGRH